MQNKKRNSTSDKQHFVSQGPAETEKIGRDFAQLLKPGDVVALCGDLGTGKTVITRGIVAGLSADHDIFVASPSFTIIIEYPTPIPIYHIDLFRLQPEDIEDLGLEDYMSENGITIIEWAEKMPYLPAEIWHVQLTWLDENRRDIVIIRQDSL
ncbi:tRNA (adenosine(37)-N6)-threonylcarbamoyltransferase complex ATPase subunit type 1 TsaE [candidate division CSSED10-310 bacterium]|uniref:tRNA threonylcarbamoyladenosine biosynthesis protein TsaE n=1 Tax=candidate division CSSED10-310 bacterium TaxID=2855610 RepID=A0ABV6YZ90_UNCC1